jgi:hypothetical protein
MLPSGNGPVATTVLASGSDDPGLGNILTILGVMLTESTISGPAREHRSSEATIGKAKERERSLSDPFAGWRARLPARLGPACVRYQRRSDGGNRRVGCRGTAVALSRCVPV